ncbi:hypothetical protein DQ04_05011040 [Trypanosoma grayi]|uniref:hypothetical protein n=1 Tax=Trypanosoma grayi TaxID=71804 RepID=UPI0004F4A1D7|nr:hypothetical protein DQ04_05011040 [Trypanosoma grayi]KEG09573.1 hypothetical protein DQ04_05011040 [Trypanosoma grayi]
MKERRRTRRTLVYCLFFVLLSGALVFIAPLLLQEDAVDNIPLSSASRANHNNDICGRASSCLDCLFPPISARFTSDVRRSSPHCFWCSATERCVPRGSREDVCIDSEEQSCPAVLHTTIPNAFRVVHVGIRKGGPEALIQLHLALNRWGFRTTLDTRQKEKGGAVVPFFREMYKVAFARAPPLRWFRNYAAWQNAAVEGDVLIATETWPCLQKDHLAAGVRQMQWHLTVWPRSDRSHCTIAGHTNYLAMSYMNQSKLAVLYPYVSPHIVELAQTRSSWRAAKRRGTKNPLVLFDADVKLRENDLMGRHGVVRDLKRATGLAPEELYSLYGEAMAGVDLQLPGAERFVFEAVLFDVCVIVDDSLVGGCKDDVPVPEAFRVPAGDVDALNNAIDRCISDYDTVMSEFKEMKQFTLRQKKTFERQVRRYFSNSVHVVSLICSQVQSELYLVRFILNILLHIPFATVEIRLGEGVTGLTEQQQSHLLKQSWLAAVRFVHLGSRETAEVCRVSGEVTANNPQRYHESAVQLAYSITLPTGSSILSNANRTLLALFVPIDVVIVNEEAVHYITTQLALIQRQPLGKNEFALFLLDSSDVEVANVPLIAVWTADAPSLVCGHMVIGDVPLLDKACRQKQYLAASAGERGVRKAIVVHDRGDDVVLARFAPSSGAKDRTLQIAWDFMCLHALWKDFVGGC